MEKIDITQLDITQLDIEQLFNIINDDDIQARQEAFIKIIKNKNKYLLEKDKNGNTFLHLYLNFKLSLNLDILNSLLSDNQEHKIIKNNSEQTPLHLFCKNYKFDISLVNALLYDNNHKKMLDSLNYSPLHYIINNKNKSIEHVIFLTPKFITNTKCTFINCKLNNKLSSRLINKTLDDFGIKYTDNNNILDLITSNYTYENYNEIKKSMALFYNIQIESDTYRIYISHNMSEITNVKIYKMGKSIAKGSFNITYRCTNIIEEKEYLLRISMYTGEDKEYKAYVENLKHIILYILICSKKNIKFIPEPICIGLLYDNVIMIMEAGIETFDDYITKNSGDNKILNKTLLSVYNDLYFLNNDLGINFKHNDLRGPNIVMTSTNVPLLIDFGYTQFTIKIKCEKEYKFKSSFHNFEYDDWKRNITHDMLQLLHSLNFVLTTVQIDNLFKFKTETEKNLLNHKYYIEKIKDIITYNDVAKWILKKKIKAYFTYTEPGSNLPISNDNIPSNIDYFYTNSYSLVSDRKINFSYNRISIIIILPTDKDPNFNISEQLNNDIIHSIYYSDIDYLKTSISVLNSVLTPSELALKLDLVDYDIIIDKYKNKYLKYKNKYLKYKK